MFRTGEIQAGREPHLCVSSYGDGRDTSIWSLHIRTTAPRRNVGAAFLRRLVGLFGICSGDTSHGINNRHCSVLQPRLNVMPGTYRQISSPPSQAPNLPLSEREQVVLNIKSSALCRDHKACRSRPRRAARTAASARRQLSSRARTGPRGRGPGGTGHWPRQSEWHRLAAPHGLEGLSRRTQQGTDCMAAEPRAQHNPAGMQCVI